MQAFETSALLIVFVLLGKILECKVKALTSKATSELSRLTLDVATLVGTATYNPNIDFLEQEEEKIPLSLLQYQGILLVRSGGEVPTDGTVIRGESSVDEAILTDESVPVNKAKGDELIGGTINIDGAIFVEVTSIGEETTLANIIKLIETAQSPKAPIQEFADKVSAKFVPIVTGISVFTYILWTVLFNSGPLESVKEGCSYTEEGLNDWNLLLLFCISCEFLYCSS